MTGRYPTDAIQRTPFHQSSDERCLLNGVYLAATLSRSLADANSRQTMVEIEEKREENYDA